MSAILSERFVCYCTRWSNINEKKNLNEQPKEQLKRASTSSDERRIVELFDKNPGMPLDGKVERLREIIVNVSRSTVRRRLMAEEVRGSSRKNGRK